MKLVFSRDEEQNVVVKQKDDDTLIDFSYISLIRSLLDEGPMEDPEIEGEFSESEIGSINRMIEMINSAAEIDDGDAAEEEIIEEEEFDEDDDLLG